MLRWILPLVAAFAIGPAAAADGPVVTKRAYRAAHQLPPGLPRAHYKYRTTIAAPTYSRGVAVVEEPELLFTPSSNVVPYIPPWSARLYCPAPRRCQAITGARSTTIIRARTTAAPKSPTGTACPTPAASTAIANPLADQPTWQRHRERPNRPAQRMRSPPSSSPCWSR